MPRPRIIRDKNEKGQVLGCKVGENTALAFKELARAKGTTPSSLIRDLVLQELELYKEFILT